MLENRISSNLIMSISDELFAYILTLMSTPNIRILGGTNKKIYDYTRIVIFLRTVHTFLREKPKFERFWWNFKNEIELEKEHIALEGILNKLSFSDDNIIQYNFLISLDTSSLKNFNRSINWMDEQNNDLEWVDFMEDLI